MSLMSPDVKLTVPEVHMTPLKKCEKLIGAFKYKAEDVYALQVAIEKSDPA